MSHIQCCAPPCDVESCYDVAYCEVLCDVWCCVTRLVSIQRASKLMATMAHCTRRVENRGFYVVPKFEFEMEHLVQRAIVVSKYDSDAASTFTRLK